MFKEGSEWCCERPDYKYRNVVCKHIFAVIFSLEMRKEVASSDEVFQLRKQKIGVSDCLACGSPNVMKAPEKLRTERFNGSDGLHSYTKAFKKEFFSRYKKDRVEHLRKPRFIDSINNNMVERFQGTIRERDKVMRSMKEEIQTIVDGLRNYYNFIRPHQSLNGKTPAEIANIDLGLGKNKWLLLIKKASKEVPKS